MFLQILLSLTFVKDKQQEMPIFNEGPINKSSFIACLRKFHYSLLFSVYLLHFLAVTYFIEHPLISCLLGLMAFINLTLYLVQFVVYTNEYITKSSKSNRIFSTRIKPSMTLLTD